MRIALVHRDLHAITRGGICTLYRALAPRLRNASHAVALITQRTPHPLALAGIEVFTLPRTENLAAHRRAVDEVLAALRPDIVESSSWEAETLDYAMRPAGNRAPVVVRGDLSAATMRAWPHLITAEHDLLRIADAVLAVSEFAAIDLAGAYRVPAPIVVANGVDRDRFHPGPVAAPVGGETITLAPDATTATSHPLTSTGEPWPPPWGDPGQGRRRLVWVGRPPR